MKPNEAISHVIDAMDQADQPNATFRAVDQALKASVGHILFTVLISHHAAGESERFYTNMPDAYPVGGRKPIGDRMPLRQALLVEGKPYIGRTAADIEWAFFDHALIRSLGCESVLNMPVRWRGTTLGTLNLLDRAHAYEERHLPTVRALAALAAPAMLMLTRP